MSLKRTPLPYLILLLLIPIGLTSCTPPAEIHVACDVDDLIDAINSANANIDTTKLILDPNCTYSFTSKDNTDGGAGPNALPLITTKIKIEGNNAILTKAQTLGSRFFFITNSGNLRIEDITLENGYAFRGDHPTSRGGAIYNDEGAFRAERSIFLDNNAWNGDGGAIYNLGILTLDDTTFEINSSINGGAIYNSGITNIDAVLQDVVFDTNIARGSGGAIYNASAEQGFHIIGSTFDNNHSYENGGAIYTETGALDISSSEFLDNQSGGMSNPIGDGGAIFSLAGDVTLYGTQFYLQKAYGVGGILYAGPGSNVRLREVRSEESKACHGGGALYVEGETEIHQTTLKNSRAGGHGYGWGWGTYHPLSQECWLYHGGAVYNSGTLAIDQSLIDSFYAMGDGDGVYNLGDLIVVNSTFFSECCTVPEAMNNQGSAELSFTTLVYSGLVNSGTMSVKNIVVAANTNACNNSGTLVDMDENVALDSSCPFSTILASQFDLKIDLLNLTDNGGPTLTNKVKWDSPVINMATCTSVAGDPVLIDQRGETRPIPGSGSHVCDVGAYEVQDLSPPPPPPPAPSGDEPSECDPFAGMEISVITLSLNPETLVLPVYLRFKEAVPEIGEDGIVPYQGKLGTSESFQADQQGFPDRLYFMFNMSPASAGSVLNLEIQKEGCEDPVFSQPNLAIPELPAGIPDQSDGSPVCRKDLGPEKCKEVGGKMSSGVTTAPYCICP
jgi:predicted outer membrane repeat protein